MDTQNLWSECREILRSQVSETTWNSWFEAVHFVGVDNGMMMLAVGSPTAKERLEGRYGSLLDDAVNEIGRPDLKMMLVVDPQLTDGGEQDAGQLSLDDALGSSHGTSPAAPSGVVAAENVSIDGHLSPRYTFDAFVIGSSNRFAHAAALAVAETPGRSYNPLFVYGDAGLGKTHLLHAIGNYVRENFPNKHVRYISSETFVNEFIEAIRIHDRDMTGFKRRYRECDVLLVDDVQFLENKEQTQEEFFHTFNHLYSASKQIVLTSDRNPKSIATLEERLKSRFMSGLITEVQPPELETRIAILRVKAEHEPVTPPDDVLEFIASNVSQNIRELEGALTRVCAYSNLVRRSLTLDLAETVLADIVASRQPRRITAQDILQATSVMFGFPTDDLCGPSRRRPLVLARQISMYVFRELTDFSYPAIAREFGGRDHTTVIHAVDKIANMMREKRQVYDQVTTLTASIRNGG